MSSMPDLAAALQGAPPGAAGGPPIDPSMMGGPPPDAGLPPEDPSLGADTGGETDTGVQYSNSLEALDGAEQALHAFIQLDPDEADRAAAAQCLQKVIQLKAANQTSAQAGDGKSLLRALAGGPEAVGGPGGAGLPPGGAGPASGY